MKKRHMDPNAKRDFSVLDEEDRGKITEWLMTSMSTRVCPHVGCENCVSLFPEMVEEDGQVYHCPCNVLYLKDVIKIAKQAIGGPA